MSQTSTQDGPIIPPVVLLGVAGVGLLAAAANAFISQELGFIGLAGVIVAVFSLGFWAATNPEQIRNILKGRFLLFGGTAGVVTLVLAVALVVVYVLVRQVGLRVDLSQNNNFSLNEAGQQVITLLGQDPTTPPLQITVFYTAAQARNRDLAAVLLDQVQQLSGGRITYRFVDPDREPLIAQRLNAAAGQIALSRLTDDGQPDPDNTTQIPALTQQLLLDALISASASGTFRAYVVQAESTVNFSDSRASGGSIFAADLRDRYKWTLETVTLLDVQTGRVDLNAPADGRVLIIPGGREPLPDDQAQAIIDYLEGGGTLLLLADFNFENQNSLATTELLNGYFEQAFGFRINNDLVLDPRNRLPQDPTTLITGNFVPESLARDYDAVNNGLLMQFPHSITLGTPPSGVLLSPIVRSMEGSYAKTDLDFTTATTGDLAQDADDPLGPFVLGVQAENPVTGAKVVVFTTPSLVFNVFFQYEASGGRNFDLMRRAAFWAAGYENFAASIASSPAAQPAPLRPIIATEEQLSQINFFAVFLIPISVLIVGIAAWWLRRERAIA
ncbi:Gldg family protein [Aggregatilineales bacterium SYSU G02658]